MHATQIINTHLKKMCQVIHKKRMISLMSMVEACIQGKKLSVTGLHKRGRRDLNLTNHG